jgi:hypothetical protein
MLYFPIRNVFVEGPDCSGKTTLISNIHNKTGYKWHLFDRSQISRSIFSRMYNRELMFSQLHEREEINDLNNSYIFLSPDWSIVKSRFFSRGDDIHNIHSLKNVYDEFDKKLLKLKNLPNFLDLSNCNQKDVCNKSIDWLDTREAFSLDKISEDVYNFCKQQEGEEAVSLQFSIADDGMFDQADAKILDKEGESEYYQKILLAIKTKLANEFSGLNEYKKSQNIFSRRFVYADISCISMIHILYRENRMEVNIVLRSTNVDKTFPYDLKFCYFLSSEIYKGLGLIPKTHMCIIRFNLNSAHVVW